MSGKEIHHWNYNFKNDVFILSPRAHKLIHKFISFDKKTNMFRLNVDNSILDTKENHFRFIKSVFIENNVNYEIDTFNIC